MVGYQQENMANHPPPSSLAKGYDPLYSSRAARNPWLAKMPTPRDAKNDYLSQDLG